MECSEHLSEHHCDNVNNYTDGSKEGDAVGCAAVSAHATVARRLQANTSSFSAELDCIEAAVSIIDMNNHSNFTVVVSLMILTRFYKFLNLEAFASAGSVQCYL